MRRLLLFASIYLLLQISAFATWSVLAVDRRTGRVVSASATCVNGDDNLLMSAAAVIVPGKGVAACQAAADSTKANQMLVFHELQKGTDPKVIIEMLAKDPMFQSRQFGIVDLEGRFAGHSGLNNGFVSQHMGGQVPGTEIFYSIQANTMRNNNVIPNAVKAFMANTGAITDRVMAAMEAADASGGDARCTCDRPPVPEENQSIPCDGRTTLIAYILMAEKTDTNGNSHNNGKYSMFINVSQPQDNHPSGIQPGENLNPVKTLRMRYDVWRRKQPANFK
jgi:Family of unknown function (DUF1028)